MEFFSNKQLDKLSRKYPLHSQEDKGLDTLVVYKLYQPDRRNNGDGFWYIFEGERIGDEVQFTGITGNAARPQAADVRPFLYSTLVNWASRSGQVIELDTSFKPGTLRDLYETEPWLQGYIDRLKEQQRRREIMEQRDQITDSIFGHFSSLDEEGTMARKIAESLTDAVISEMIGNRREITPAILRALAMRLGLLKVNIRTL